MNTTKHVLLVEDDLDDQFLFLQALKSIHPGILCSVAGNGIEALEILSELAVDLIFMDLNMPKLNGLECLKKIKDNEDLKHIPVIILSTSASPADIQKSMLLGAQSYFTKPPTFRELFAKLEDILK